MKLDIPIYRYIGTFDKIANAKHRAKRYLRSDLDGVSDQGLAQHGVEAVDHVYPVSLLVPHKCSFKA